MIAKIKEYFRKRKESWELSEVKRGYDYAAGELLRGVPINIVENYAFNPFNDGLYHFNRGVIEATNDWERLLSN